MINCRRETQKSINKKTLKVVKKPKTKTEFIIKIDHSNFSNLANKKKEKLIF